MNIEEPVEWAFPIPERRKSVYRFYKLVFDQDGCPMKAMPHGNVFHPILGAYLIFEYVRWYEETRDKEYLEHAKRVARQALAKAERLQDALVFYYTPESKLSYIPKTFYSALTQAWYVHALSALGRYAGTEFEAALTGIYRSLLVPVGEGGCFIQKDYGWIVEEYPTDPPLFTLNGWLTVLKMVSDHRETLDRLGCDPEEFLRQNLRAVRKLLPLYDAEFCANSRYQLTGFTRVRVVLDKPVPYELKAFSVEIPGEGTYPGSFTKGANRWNYYLERSEKRLLQFNIVQSLISHPEPNVFVIDCKVAKPCKATVMVGYGEYQSNLSSMRSDEWRTVGYCEFVPGGDAQRVALAWDDQNLFAYPTNFSKRIDTHFFNAYHYIHIGDLAWLHAVTGEELFREYALKWLSYAQRWPQLPALRNPEISFGPHKYTPEQFRDKVEKSLAMPTRRIRL